MSFRVDLCTFINILLCLAHDVSRKHMFVVQTPAACQPTSQRSTRCERVCEKGFSSRISYRTQHARNEIRFLVTVVHSTYLPVVWIDCQNFDLAILSIATAPTNNNSGAGGSEPYAKWKQRSCCTKRSPPSILRILYGVGVHCVFEKMCDTEYCITYICTV